MIYNYAKSVIPTGADSAGWHPNLLNPSECSYGSISSGVVTTVPSIQTYCGIVTGYIPVKAGTTYSWKEKTGSGSTKVRAGSCWYDSSKVYSSEITMTNTTYATYATAPADGYMRLYIYLGSGYTDETARLYIRNLMVCEDDFYQLGVFFGYGENADTMPDIARLAGKTIAVIGDSIGTWQGHNVPEIKIETADIGVQLSAYQTTEDGALTIGGVSYPALSSGTTEITFTPASADVGKTIGNSLTHGGATRRPWWFWLGKKLDCSVNNVSWSGSSITSHESGSYPQYGWHEATVRKCGTRTPGSADRVAPDIVIIARGCNDMTHTPYAKLTENLFTAAYTTPATDAVSGGYGFKEGIAKTIAAVKAKYPTAQVMCATMTPYYRSPDDLVFPMQNGIATEQAYNQAIIETADFYECPVIRFDLAFDHLSGGAIGAIGASGTSDQTHPSNYGHWLMFKRALLDIGSNCR